MTPEEWARAPGRRASAPDSEATLAVKEGGLTLDFVGSYETGFNENDSNHEEWELPNVLGVK